MKFVAVTACPTGIAHTYMAAEALEQAATAAGDEIVVETQGSAGSTTLSTADIEEADAVVLAADVGVQDRGRFANKPVVEATVKQAVNDAAGLIEQARGAAGSEPEATAAAQPVPPEPAGRTAAGSGMAGRLRQWLMTGVSYVIPFVAAGGLLIALSFALGGYRITEAPDVTEYFDPASLLSWAALANQIGSAAFEFLVPVLAGFIAFAMADRPALAPGFVGGAAAVAVEAGFLGGLVAGLLAGAVVAALQRIRVPRAVAGIMPVVVLPLLGSLVVGALMFVLLGKPIAAAMSTLTGWLNGLTGAGALLLGALLGGMIAFDMGGPVNKVAYTFAVGGLSTGSETALEIMAAVMGAGMVPPLALALAATVRSKLFGPAEQESARPAWLLGASFITEGAIPFAAADPLRVIPAMVTGSATTGALSMMFGATLRAPHGGLFVLPLVGQPLLYMLAIAVGVVVAAVAVMLAKQIGRAPATAESAPSEAAVAA
ncbi:PTS system D-fructose-specific IIB component (F1P-forming) (Frc family) /PTS system D-fructose-specific IIC component (F1P-forming) (Frc family) [Halopolyspora algeriensis]|uniref:PTS system D-fructose-specific IIB component (F1P-forming) (Frc family) /PTS system D-fructose-specific IIC component (F1P-forming) (Frc family) n=1 Tax=Halopolyspora algeriensis TaxID=1500506 RepID=A0A368VGN9_9ACTN|nr:fructose-specific PTS transporter subunit EIIC [Halopolyspora algeriensis]RCW40488.1 PTS system D-fructose-specific IIB component (F1P-forming) (Frc family) /PTS system D-fructose-specific IIC component (F1P-forming) (Frc family) [Halopolyspora algeriensis]TQM53771.1 PTS system D-fructose-specific IIB component (F1P-forming) (Frc family) /PTS system D-fructose-specific IIC component (F1P-forming) (Frc family) [Halopolyspora algeriensis]